MADTLHAALERLGLSGLHDTLAAHGLTAETLGQVDEQALRDLGLSFGQRSRLLKAVRAGHRPMAERRELTTLYCDLVDTARIAAGLAPDRLRELMQAYLRFSARVLRAHGGHIAYAQGDGVMAYFGYPRAEADDPVRAVRAGLDVARQVPWLATAAAEPLQVRIGIATGTVVVADAETASAAGALVVGDAPGLAARLQEASDPGEVVIDEATRSRLGAAFRCESRGSAEVRPAGPPVPIHRVCTGRAADRPPGQAVATAPGPGSA